MVHEIELANILIMDRKRIYLLPFLHQCRDSMDRSYNCWKIHSSTEDP